MELFESCLYEHFLHHAVSARPLLLLMKQEEEEL